MSKIQLIKGAGLDWMHEAPCIQGVVVSHPSKKTKRSKGLMALVNTGSDVSIVPESAIKGIGLKQTEHGCLVVDGDTAKPYAFYDLCFELCGERIGTNRAIVGKHDFIVLGRDVLRHTTLTVCWIKEKSGLLVLASEAA